MRRRKKILRRKRRDQFYILSRIEEEKKRKREVKIDLSPKSIFLIVTTFQCLEDTRLTIQSLRNQSIIDKCSILVVDNCSTDGTLEYLSSEQINHIILKGRKSVAHAWNTGIRYAIEHDADYIFVFNNDIDLERNYIEKMIEDYNKLDDCIFMNGVDYLSPPRGISRGIYEDMDDTVYTGDFSAFLVTPKTIEIVGYFDEIYEPRYVEDNDFLHRIYLAGYRGYRNRRCRFRHFGGKYYYDHPEERAKKIDLFKKNLLLYYSKWGDLPRGAQQHPPLYDLTKNYPCRGGTYKIPYNGNVAQCNIKIDATCILQLGRLGDIVATLPVAEYYKRQGDKIVWLCSHHYKDFLSKISYIDQLISIRETSNIQENIFGIGYHKARKIGEQYRDLLIPQINPEYEREFYQSSYSFNRFIYVRCGINRTLIPSISLDRYTPRPKKKRYKIGLSLSGLSCIVRLDYSKIDNLLDRLKKTRDIEIVNLSLEPYQGRTEIDNRGSKLDIDGVISELLNTDLLVSIDTGIWWLSILTRTPSIHILPNRDTQIQSNDPRKFSAREQQIDRYIETVDYWYSKTDNLENMYTLIVEKLFFNRDLREVL